MFAQTLTVLEPFEIRPPGGAVVNKIQIAVTSLIPGGGGFDIQKCANNILCFKLDFAPYGTIKSDILVKKKLNVNSKTLRG